LAVVAWETLTCERLFAGDSDVETLRRIASGQPLQPSTVRAELAPFDAVLVQALARDPGARFASVQAFAEALEDRARRLGWVAPHSEVARTVDSAAGDSLRQRRTEFESPGPVSTSRLSKRPVSARDAMNTRSLPGDAPFLAAATPSPAAVVVPKAAPTRPWTRRRAVLVASAAVCLVGAVSTVLAVHGHAARSAANAGDTPSADISGEPVPPSSAPPPVQASAAASADSVPVYSLPTASASPAPPAAATRAPSRPQPGAARSPSTPPPAHTHSSPIRYHDPG
jgi:serine/threonine-protein kinase